MSSADGPVGIATKPPVESARQVRVEEECGDGVLASAFAFGTKGEAEGWEVICAIYDSFAFHSIAL